MKDDERWREMEPSGEQQARGQGCVVTVCVCSMGVCVRERTRERDGRRTRCVGWRSGLRTEGWGSLRVTWVLGSVSSWLSGSRPKGYLLHESIIKCASASGKMKFGNTLFLGTNHGKY